MSSLRAVRRARGFTLIELLVAMFLLAVLSAFAYGTLSYVQKAREFTQVSFGRQQEIEVAVHTLVTDFEQLAPRPIRQPLGSDYLPAIIADPRTQELVTFTRGGWSNSAGLPRSTLQRVSYRYDKDRAVLVRSYTNVLDAPLSAEPVKRDLLTRVESVTLRYMPSLATAAAVANGTPSAATQAVATAPQPLSGNNIDTSSWLTQWPPAGAATGAVASATAPSTTAPGTPASGTPGAAVVLPRLRPRAVEITLELKDYGRIVRIVEVPG
jgi:general secretion pathway protein J